MIQNVTINVQYMELKYFIYPCTIVECFSSKKLSVCWDRATCEPVDACRHLFPYASLKFRITGKLDTIRVGFGMQVSKTPTYSVLCRFPHFVALREHNPPTF